MNEITSLERRVLYKRVKSFIPGIVATVCVVVITAILILLYPKMENHKQLLFGISLVWPSGVIVVLVPMWTEFVRSFKDNPGSDLRSFLNADITKNFLDSPHLLSSLLDFLNQRYREISSPDTDIRRKALKEIIEAIHTASKKD